MNYNKLTKKQSGLIFLMVYGFSFLLGLIIILGWKDKVEILWLMLFADIIMTIAIYFIGIILKNASLYDPYWSVVPIYIILIWLVVYGLSFDVYNIILLVLILIWGIRLTYNWWKNWHGFSTQDWRYDMLREKNTKLYPITNFFGIHMIPTLVVYIQMINVYRSLNSSLINLIVFVVGVLLCLFAPVIQFISDRQMFNFRLNNKGKLKVINTGLWRFSRHPNYFAELMFWVGIYVIYLSKSMKFDINIIYPILMILLFVFISIPMMENKIKNREGYEDYKSSVSVLFPFPQKKN